MNILKKINSHADLMNLSDEQLPELCRELRSFLLEKVSRSGGHLSANLGAVELTVALHRVYQPDRDRILFDVGHQCYVHKILTGRRGAFDTLRQLDGLSGFPKPCESECDPFVAGHASDSVSVALGMARARTLTGGDYGVVAVIGDGALTGGLSYEGLCDAGQSGEPLVVVLNDNGMSINPNVGGMALLLSRARVRPSYIRFKRRYRHLMRGLPHLYRLFHALKERVKDHILPSNLFDDLGFYYIGPVDGHNVNELETQLRWARDLRKPVLLHVVTVKGRGVGYAEENPQLYHGVGPFDPDSGEVRGGAADFSAVFGETLREIAGSDRSVCAVTAAMADGTGLSAFAERFPDRFFDVGIAEEHAVAMCGGLAKQGMKPVFAVYSSFLQRAYDELIEDWSLMGLHAVLAVDRTGLVGHDGETHHGSFSAAYLCSVPGMTVYVPASFQELREMLPLAIEREEGPAAVCYPRGGEGEYRESHAYEPSTRLREGADVTLVSHGILINEALRAARELAEQGVSAEVIKLNTLRPLDKRAVVDSLRKTGRLIVAEETCRAGSPGTALLAAAAAGGVTLRGAKLLDLGSGIVTHGDVASLRGRLGIDAAGIVRAALDMVR